MHEDNRTHEADVLVIGGGAAGLTAALEARAAGAEVLMVAKSRAGRGGNTVVAGCQFCAVVPYPGSPDSPEQHFQDSLAGGQWVNDEGLLRTLAEEGGRRLLKLEEWGVRLLRSGGELVRRTPNGHRHPRGIITDYAEFPASTGGLSITLPLRKAADAAGVRFLDGVPVVRLLVSEGQARGAVGIEMEGGESVVMGARAVVVAAGGAGHIFANTNNTRGICGDSYGLMLEAGAILRDMEFVQFYPSQMSRPLKVAVASPMFADGAVLRNRHGERFMPLYDPERADLATRDVMSRAIFYEVQKGNGVEGEVYMDCTAVPEGVLQAKYGTLVRDLRKHGIDPAQDWLRIGCTTHFFMGGAAVDGRSATTVPGLFAAGEAIGGVHGANRLAGNALTEAVVFGGIAGEAAAEYSRQAGTLPAVPPSAGLREHRGGLECVDDVRGRLRDVMWKGASLVRSELSLKGALVEVRECRDALARCPAGNPLEQARWEETRLMCLTAEAVALSALARRESRGAHFREDCPESGDVWLGSHRVRLQGDELRVEFVAKHRL